PHGLAVPLAAILTLVQELCAPLAYLHGEGLVHRDLKPDNVLVRPNGQPVLMDFGLVTQFTGEVQRERLQVEGEISGTLAYMAPEQIRGEPVDARADLYSLGCILYELLVGHPPFLARSERELLREHLESVPLAPSRHGGDLPSGLDALVLRLLAK